MTANTFPQAHVGNQAGRLSPLAFSFLQKHVYGSTGIVLDGTKEYLLETRLTPLVQQMRLKSIDELCNLLTREPAGMASRKVIDCITTNETLFFRDAATFQALRNSILPNLLKRAENRRLRVWSAAASSGQEVYSIAMTLLEMGLPTSRVEIHATDISEAVLQKAMEGSYAQFEVDRGVPAALLAKYFAQAGSIWRIRDDVRRMVRYERHDLRHPYRDGTFDLVLCRNVLIYFDGATKQTVLSHIVNAMEHGSVLTLGCAETVANRSLPLDRKVFLGSAFYLRKG